MFPGQKEKGINMVVFEGRISMCLYLSGKAMGWCTIDGRVIVLKGQGKLMVF